MTTDEDRKQDRGTIGDRGGRVPVIGIGGSAGALESLNAFFEATPADMGAAVVVIQHLAPFRKAT